MKTLRALGISCLVVLFAHGEFRPVPAQQKAVDIEALLLPQRQNIVCFYSLNNPICRSLYPGFQKLAQDNPKLEFHAVDVGSVQSATSQKYAIQSVPYFKIYNGRGELVSEGASAYRQVTDMMAAP